MGGHSPPAFPDAEGSSNVLREIIWPTLRGLRGGGPPFRESSTPAHVTDLDEGPGVQRPVRRPETSDPPRVVSDMAAVLRCYRARRARKVFAVGGQEEVCAGVVLGAAAIPASPLGKVITG